MKAWLCVILLALPLGACEKKADTTQQTPPTPMTQPTDKAGTVQPASVQADQGADIPTEHDFEDEAEQKINAQNLEDELTKLEKEVAESG